MKNWNRILILTCLLAPEGVAQRASDAERELEAAINKEVVQGDVNGAIGLYRRVVSRYASQREVVAKALLHLGECHEKLGQSEARKNYERIVNEFSDHRNVVVQARARLASLSGSTAEGGVRVRRLFEGADGCVAVAGNDQWATCYRRGDLYVRNVASGKETLAAREAQAFAISSDARQVAFTIQDRETRRYSLWLASADGTGRRQIEGPTPYMLNLAFSNDGKSLFVYYQKTGDLPGQIWLHPTNGGQGRKLYDTGAEFYKMSTAVFSPDDAYVLFSGGSGPNMKMIVLPMKAGAASEIAPAIEDRFSVPVGFAADGRLVYHRQGGDAGPSLWTVPFRQGRMDGQAQLLQSGIISDIPGRYYSSGRYYYRQNNRRVELLTVALDGPLPLQTRKAEGDGNFGVSPDYSSDGKFIAYGSPHQRSGRVFVRNLEAGDVRDYNTSMGPVDWVRWYPDGSALLVLGYRGGTQGQKVGVRLDLKTRELSNVLPPMGPPGNTDASLNPSFSRDGRYIYYKRFYSRSERRRVQRFDLTTGKEEDVYQNPPAPAGLRIYSNSPDGQHIAVLCFEGNGNWIGVAPLAGGETKVIYRFPAGPGSRGFNGLAWTADSKSVFFHATNSDTTDQLWRVNIDGSRAERLLTTNGIINSIAVHPNGREITIDNRIIYQNEMWVLEGLK